LFGMLCSVIVVVAVVVVVVSGQYSWPQHSDGSHVTTSANCGNNATKVSWETHTKLHAQGLKHTPGGCLGEVQGNEGGGGVVEGWRLKDATANVAVDVSHLLHFIFSPSLFFYFFFVVFFFFWHFHII